MRKPLLLLGLQLLISCKTAEQAQVKVEAASRIQEEERAREFKAHTEMDISSSSTQFYIYLEDFRLPNSLKESSIQVAIKGPEDKQVSIVIPDPSDDSRRLMRVIPLAGLPLKGQDDSREIFYKATRRLSWHPPKSGTTLRLQTQTVWESTKKEGLSLDMGFKPLPLVFTGDYKIAKEYLTLTIEYLLNGEKVSYTVDLSNPTMLTNSVGEVRSEILVPTGEHKEIEYRYFLRFDSRTNGRTENSGIGTIDQDGAKVRFH